MFPFMPLIGTGRRMGEPSIPHVWMTKRFFEPFVEEWPRLNRNEREAPWWRVPTSS